MGNQFDNFRQAVNEAETTLRAADNVADDMARLLRGRLQKVPSHILAELKKELKDFNAHTGKWKNEA